MSHGPELGVERVPGTAGVLVTVGDLVEDVVVWTCGPVAHATDNPARIVRTRGGSAANVAALARPLGPTRFIGRVGDDALGRALVAELEAAGVDTRVQRAGRTGSIVVLVDDAGERTMFPDRGAAAELSDVDPGWLRGAGVVHVPAYALATEVSHAATLRLLAAARAAGALVSLDAASAGLIRDLGARAVRDVLGGLHPDLLFANAGEATLLGLADNPLPGTTVVVKDGAAPVRVTGPDGGVQIVPADAVPVVRDTTGAGDAFAAGYLGAVLRGAQVPAAVAAGSGLAATVLGSPGATAVRPPASGASAR
jgi:sugar/nucleoside kinase (ribokinase family)